MFVLTKYIIFVFYFNKRLMKLGKIGVRFNFQQNLGIKIVSEKNKDIEEQPEVDKFPIYVQVTYKRKNTKFRIGNLDYTKDEYFSSETQKLLEEVDRKIRTIIEFENLSLGDKFTLKGLGKRYEKYDESVSVGLYHVLNLLISDNLLLFIDDMTINSKELFFCNGLLGLTFFCTLTDDLEKKQFYINSLVDLEQIGSMLLDRNHFNIVFSNKVKEALNSFINIFDKNQHRISIYNWFQDTLNNKQFSFTNKVNELLWQYLIE